ncbi:molybdopterin biosynthesis protein [Halorubellus sp. JP-L1]|uniref:molybdopterin biosynthesis protein n=1 Tax=Halorubellus sp. JP-L1 TaxID=2715753 RepID=UPI0014090891|nr:molybdopterin biosynthesis protein [Halorubellus sp. JP-L1]NHN43246.1 molybdopterin biosynthesis protein [Halorubellus sp. JP-L1]
MSDHREFRDLATPETLRETLADLDVDAGSETVGLDDARGRVLAERVDAGIDVPGFDRAAMDGYAVRAADTFGASETDPATLDVVGAVHAGERPAVSLESGDAVEISTGAVVPGTADAVVMVERTSETDGQVAVRTAVAPGEHVMAAGADIAAGQRALGPGTLLTPREVGLLSALGVADVPVRARPRVAVVSTGDELVPPGDDLDHGAGEIHDVNTHAIAAGVREAGGDPVVYEHVGDDRAAMTETIETAASECDIVLTSGSTSASAMDVVYRVVEDRGERLLHGVAVKPGKPTLVGTIDGTAYVGLPGYPVSALSIFRTFVAPRIREAAGRPPARTATVDARMATRERSEEGRLRLVPVGLVADGDGDLLAYPVDKGSGATTTLTAADGVVPVDPDTNYVDAGEAVTVSLFSANGRPPRVLVVGEDDPTLSRALDAVADPRYLASGSRAGRRSLRDDVADVAALAGPDADEALTGVRDADEALAGDSDAETDRERDVLAFWDRDWGLVVPAGNPVGVDGLAALVDDDVSFANRDAESGLRARLDAALDALAAERDVSRDDLVDAIRGYELETGGPESPARRVADGIVDVGLGSRGTADRLGLGFVPLGTDRVAVVAASDRAHKPGVADLERALDATD